MLYQFDRSRRASVAVLCAIVNVFATDVVLASVLTIVPALDLMSVISCACVIELIRQSLDPPIHFKKPKEHPSKSPSHDSTDTNTSTNTNTNTSINIYTTTNTNTIRIPIPIPMSSL